MSHLTHDTPDGEPELPFRREYRFYGWERIVEHCQDDELREVLAGELEANKPYKQTTSLELALYEHEALAIDAIAKQHGIDPNHIPDMGLNMAIRGEGIQHKKDE